MLGTGSGLRCWSVIPMNEKGHCDLLLWEAE